MYIIYFAYWEFRAKKSRSEGNKETVKKMKIEVFYHCLCSVLFCLVHVVFVGFLGQLFNMPRKI